jgi:hypothetical protein
MTIADGYHGTRAERRIIVNFHRETIKPEKFGLRPSAASALNLFQN